METQPTTLALHQAISEALWRPTIPLIVVLQVKEPNLRSVWLALRILTAVVPHAADTGFTARDIVDLAGVTDSHIHTYLATLVERGVVCKRSETDSTFPYPKSSEREGRRKCVRYGLDLASLERRSIDAYPELVARYTKRYPAPTRANTAPTSAQQPLFVADDAADPNIWQLPTVPLRDTQPHGAECHAPIGGTAFENTGPHGPIGGIQPAGTTAYAPIGGSIMPLLGACGIAMTPIEGMAFENIAPHAPIGGMALGIGGRDMPPVGACDADTTPIRGMGIENTETHAPNRGTDGDENVAHVPIGGMALGIRGNHAPIGGRAMPPIGAWADENSQKHTVLEEEERVKIAHARANDFQAPANAEQQATSYRVPSEATFIQHPTWVRGGSLPDHPLELWQQCAGTRVRANDGLLLADLAGQHEYPTTGHGWYWLGRAVLAASLLDKNELPYIRKILNRWRQEDSYGSDAEPRRLSRRDSVGMEPSYAASGRSGRAGGDAGNPRAQRQGKEPFNDWER